MKNYFSLIICAIAFIFAIGSIKAETYKGSDIFSQAKNKKLSSDISLSSDIKKISATEFMLSKSNSDIIFGSSKENILIKDFPVDPVNSADIELTKVSSVVDKNTKWYKSGKNGKELVQLPAFFTFKGKIAGEVDSKVVLTYTNGYINASIKHENGETYDISSKESGSASIASQNLLLNTGVYNTAYESNTPDVFGTSSEKEDLKKIAMDQTLAGQPLIECRIAIEGIYNYYTTMGKNYDKAAAYIVSVMSYVSILYEEFLNVKIYIPEILIRTTEEDDYYLQNGKDDFDTKLAFMPVVWEEDRPENVALICMFAALKGQPGGSLVAGLSYGGAPGKGSLCSLTKGYSIFGINGDENYPNYNYTWDVSVAAHEIGHNFGAPHTHNCYWEPNMIDTCVTKSKPVPVGDACLDGDPIPRLGTLMSYCHISNSTNSVALQFHPRQIPHMRYAASIAECMSVVAVPTIDILSPLVNNKYTAGDKIIIRWTSSKVDNINIYYSPNLGTDWVSIANNIPSKDSIYNWSAPQLNTTEMIFKITDASNESVFDMSDSKVTVTVPGITINKPLANEEYGQREKMDVLWQSSTSNNYNVFFSSDNGQIWSKLIGPINVSAYQYELPDISSDNCLIKIEDADDASINSISPIFKIGNESLTLTKPAPGEILCGDYNYKVEWNSSYLNKILLQYSTDGGDKWKNIQYGAIEAGKQSFGWALPKGYIENVKLRAIMFDDKTVVLSESASAFVIDTCKLSSVTDEIISNQPVTLTSIIPNPVNDRAELKLVCMDGVNNINISIINANGSAVLAESTYQVNAGENSIFLNLNHLATGRYFAVIKTNTAVITYPISVIR